MNNDKMQKLTAQLMEQAQVFASSWSLFGGPFDDGSALIDAEEARAELNSMIRDALSAATGWQESEAQADILDEEEFYNICQHYRWAKDNGDAGQAFENLKCFIRRIAPPSAIAIETAAKLHAAEVCDEFACGVTGADIAEHIRDTIPQDGITELEKFGIRAATESIRCLDWNGRITDDNIRAIVKSLIGEK